MSKPSIGNEKSIFAADNNVRAARIKERYFDKRSADMMLGGYKLFRDLAN
jgi:hypothetical protein